MTTRRWNHTLWRRLDEEQGCKVWDIDIDFDAPDDFEPEVDHWIVFGKTEEEAVAHFLKLAELSSLKAGHYVAIQVDDLDVPFYDAESGEAYTDRTLIREQLPLRTSGLLRWVDDR